MPTRRPKERPNQLPLNVTKNGVRQTIALPVEDHPHHLMLPVFEPPGIFTDTNLPFDFVGTTMLVMYFNGWLEKTANLPYQEIHPHHFDFEALIRMLAKIGHGFAVAELGWGTFKPLLPDLIAWRDPALARFLVGGMDIKIPVAPSSKESRPKWTAWQLHLFFHRTHTGSFIVVRIRVFPFYAPAPQYAVVAGETTPELLAQYGLVLTDPTS
jgi:hypothetical protein